MRPLLYFLLLADSCTTILCQSSPTVNIHHTVIPTVYPNPYNAHTSNKSQPVQVANTPWSNATDENGNSEAAYSPGRPPAIPLAVRSPYTSAWSSTGNNGSLNSNPVIFWDGSALGWEGMVTVDGISYEWMGVGSRSLPLLSQLQLAIPRSVAYDSQYSNFTFDAGPMQLTASFFSPVIPQDLCRTSIPLSYLTVTTRSLDGGTHNVTLYADVNGAWVTQPSAPLTWQIYEDRQPVNEFNTTDSTSSLYTWVVQLSDQYLFGENYGQDIQRVTQGVFPQWGNFTFTSSKDKSQGIHFQSGYSINQRFQYVMGNGLDNSEDTNYRAYDEQEPVFAFEHQLGEVGGEDSAPVTYTVGYVVQPAVRLLTSAGVESLQPWWMKCYGDLFAMIQFHWSDFSQSQTLAAQFEAKLKNDVNTYYGVGEKDTFSVYSNGTPGNPPQYWYNGTGGETISGVDQYGQAYIFNSDTAYGYLEPVNSCNESIGIGIPDVEEAQAYYSMVALAARQVMAAYMLTEPSSTSTTPSDPLMFQKEISSNGNVNTVDVMFPAMPFFLYANPSLLRYIMNPLFANQESGFYPNSYAMHDLGTHFPNATGHVEGDDEYMPVEESGNMIIMVYALYRFSGDLNHLQQHYQILKQWATYLTEYALVPSVQLSTDDFAGQLANQTNLAIKGIVGLACMAEIANLVGDPNSATNYSSTATNYYSQWEAYGIDPSGTHTMLSYQWRSSWGLLYNIYPARLLNLSVIPDSLYRMQSDFYPQVSQIFGIPLDSRHYFTKPDWQMWAAATCEPSTRRLFVNGIAYWLNVTSTEFPFEDIYQTVHEGENPVRPDIIEVMARPTVGGLFSLLALGAAGITGA